MSEQAGWTDGPGPSANPTATAPATQTTSGRRRRFVELYGAKPWHLLSLLACFALTAYTVSRLFGDSTALVRITIWFVGAAVVWDLLLGPAYALVDRSARPLLRRLRVRGVPVLNYVRLPVLLSSLLLLVWAPLIFQRSEFVYRSKSGLVQDPYLERWAAVTGVLLLASAVAYAVAVARGGRHGASEPAPSDRTV